MAKQSAARKLKVFQTTIGFYDVVIATGSKAAALRAWGTRQDLFAQNLASAVADPDVIAAAVEHPDQLLKRPVGSAQPFRLDPARPTMADVDPGGEAAPNPPAAPTRPAPPDRSRLDVAELALASLLDDDKAAEAEIAAALARIDAEEVRLRERRTAILAEATATRRQRSMQRSEAASAVERERQAFHRAGGKSTGASPLAGGRS